MIKLVDKNCHFLIDGYPRELDQGIKFENEVNSEYYIFICDLLINLTNLSQLEF